MHKKTSFAKLETFLLDLGFQEKFGPGYITFIHNSGMPMIVLPGYKKREIVNPIHLLSVKKTLQDVGLLEPDEFTLKLQQA